MIIGAEAVSGSGVAVLLVGIYTVECGSIPDHLWEDCLPALGTALPPDTSSALVAVLKATVRLALDAGVKPSGVDARTSDAARIVASFNESMINYRNNTNND